MKNFWVKLIILNEMEKGILKAIKHLLSKKWSDEQALIADVQNTILDYYDKHPEYDDFQIYITFVLNTDVMSDENLKPIYILHSLSIYKNI